MADDAVALADRVLSAAREHVAALVAQRERALIGALAILGQRVDELQRRISDLEAKQK